MATTDALFTAHRRSVQRYLGRIVGHQAAADLTQEVFLRVARAGVPDTDDTGARAWVFRIARNIALTFARDTRAHRTIDAAVDAGAPATQELSAAIQQALDALQPLDRDVFVLRESAGLGYSEIAAACDLSVDAVRGRLKRARQELRAALDGPLRARMPRTVRLIAHEGDGE